MQGTPAKGSVSGYQTRRATPADVEACNAVCRRVHGHDRAGELTDALAQNTALVVEHDRRITGYAAELGFPAMWWVRATKTSKR
ncbi:MAG TPA: hypothetical protein VJ757_00375 [Pseudonocardiaceae bacterium]|nr:hypothetical protein [Pseudonocardiaceae bacterium]